MLLLNKILLLDRKPQVGHLSPLASEWDRFLDVEGY